MKYLICENVVIHNGKVFNNSSILKTSTNIKNARRYCMINCPGGHSWNVLKETSEGIFPVGSVAWTSYPKNGKTAFGWIWNDGNLRFINRDGSLGRNAPYQTWKVVNGKQVWYTKR